MQPNWLRGILDHFQTFLWLRWRIRVNQLSHGSKLGKALAAILLATVVIAGITLIVGGALVGAIVPRYFPREHYFLMWDGLIAIFVLFWVIHVATDLQRSDAITFDRILHLPVSFGQVFAINYLSALASILFLCLSSFSFGFIFGSCFSVGPTALLIAFPFILFLLAITSLTYQLQGWLAAIMSNPRRRQLVMFIIPVVIVTVVQIPTFVVSRYARYANQARSADIPPSTLVAPGPNSDVEHQDGDTEVAVNETTDKADLADSQEQAKKALPKVLSEDTRNDKIANFIAGIGMLNRVFPPLWMAGCAQSIMAGTWHVFWLSSAMFAVAFLSLRRNYRQTLRYYLGESDSRAIQKRMGKSQSLVAKPAVSATSRSGGKSRMIDWQIPFVSESTSAITVMTWQSMKRAPEAKISLLLPFVAPFVMFGALQSIDLPKVDELKASMIVGFSALVLLISTGVLGNQFGYDRAGFRAFVLSPVRRDHILLGRNIAAIPVALLQTICLTLSIGFFFGLAIDKVFASVLLSSSLLPPCLLLFNLMSILTPFPIAAGSMQPKHFDLVPVLLSMLLSMILPLITLVALFPIGIEWVVERYFLKTSVLPIALILSVFWLAGSMLLYRWLLPYEGRLFARREKELLRIVTSKIE
ncbi:MAG: ABC transporter permease [Planctomycetota bacterium]|nr:ABC transporter permease [Planctomycetota bacterium]